MKRALRARLRAARHALAAGTMHAASTAVAARLVGWPGFTRAHHVVAYIAVDGELDPGPLIAAAGTAGKVVYYPRRAGETLEFLAAEPATFGRGAADIPEPRGGEPLPHEAEAILFLVPGVAFDTRGTRLGRGAGGYDRALRAYPRALRVGLAYELQIVPDLPTDPWDVGMHAVATEARLIGDEAT